MWSFPSPLRRLPQLTGPLVDDNGFSFQSWTQLFFFYLIQRRTDWIIRLLQGTRCEDVSPTCPGLPGFRSYLICRVWSEFSLMRSLFPVDEISVEESEFSLYAVTVVVTLRRQEKYNQVLLLRNRWWFVWKQFSLHKGSYLVSFPLCVAACASLACTPLCVPCACKCVYCPQRGSDDSMMASQDAPTFKPFFFFTSLPVRQLSGAAAG